MRAEAHRRYFWLIMGSLVTLAWLVLWIWGRSPYAHYLDHGHLGELGLEGGVRGILAAAMIFVAGWTLMTIAMMLPTTLPLVEMFRRLALRRPDRILLLLLLIGGYLGIWGVFGVVAHLGHWGLRWAAGRSTWFASHPWAPGAGILILAGAYQFTPLKYRCLDRCRSPLGFILEHWQGGHERLRAFWLGVHHGIFCVGCCWALMLLMFAVGAGNIGWMLALGAVMVIEKNLPWGRRLSTPLGVILLGWGLWILIQNLPTPYTTPTPPQSTPHSHPSEDRKSDLKAVSSPFRMSSVAECGRFLRDAAGAIHEMLSRLDEEGRRRAWREIEQALQQYEGPQGFESPCEVILGVGMK